jgi:hypothetical protein
MPHHLDMTLGHKSGKHRHSIGRWVQEARRLALVQEGLGRLWLRRVVYSWPL